MENHYVLFNCNEWKNFSSMKLVGVFTRPKLDEYLKKEISEGNMEIGRNELINSLSIQELNTSLKYGYVEEITINEVI